MNMLFIIFGLIAIVLLVIAISLSVIPSTPAPRSISRQITTSCDSSRPCSGETPYCVDYKCSTEQGKLGQKCLYDQDCTNDLICSEMKICVVKDIPPENNDKPNIISPSPINFHENLGNDTKIIRLEQAKTKSNDTMKAPPEKAPIINLGNAPKSKDWYNFKKRK